MRRATGLILLGTAVAWLAWELVLVWGRARGEAWDTISIVLKDYAMASCALPYGVGLLVGHWFIPWDRHDDRAPFRFWWVWVSILACLLTTDLAVGFWAPPRETWPLWARVLRYPGLWAVLGVASGPLTWPQRTSL